MPINYFSIFIFLRAFSLLITRALGDKINDSEIEIDERVARPILFCSSIRVD